MAPTRSGTDCHGTVQETIVARKIHLHVIDATRVAAAAGLGRRINTIMQTCFFALSGVLPRDRAIAAIKRSIVKTYGKRGEHVVAQNIEAVDQALAHLHECASPGQDHEGRRAPAPRAPDRAGLRAARHGAHPGR